MRFLVTPLPKNLNINGVGHHLMEKNMNYGSVCSGVEAATLAWKGLGWQAKFFAEVEPFPSAVLMERFDATRPLRPLDPAEAENEKDRRTRESWKKQIAGLSDAGTIPNLGDFTKIKEADYDGHIDLLVGGCPCQSYSIAGLRKGLADPRGNLTLEFVRLAYRTKARIVVFENVPGLLSSGDKGSDFAGFLSLLCGWEVKPPKDGWRKCGIVTNAPGCFGVAWRILDAQYTRVSQFPRAVPQRRRRLILVGHLDSWKYPAQVLFDGEMRGGNTPPRRAKRERPAACSEGSTASAGWWDGSQKADTLTRTSDQQFMPDKRRLQCVIEEPECLDARKVWIQGKGISPTLAATDYKGGKVVSREIDAPCPDKMDNRNPGKLVCYENHGNDSRIAEVDVSPTATSRWGTGGNNTPLIQEEEPVCFIKNDAGGDLQGYWTGAFPTIRSQVIPAVAQNECFNVSFCDANGKRKDRPNGGLYITGGDASKTVTTGGVSETMVVALDGDKMAKGERKGGSGFGVSEAGVMYTQTVKDVHAIAYEECFPMDLRNATRDPEKHDAVNRQGTGLGKDGDPMTTVSASNVPGVCYQATVRRLLPVECERLMGFPDNHTRIRWKGKPEEECPDAPRYKACGNSMAVNCMMWIGERIQKAEEEICRDRGNLLLKEINEASNETSSHAKTEVEINE